MGVWRLPEALTSILLLASASCPVWGAVPLSSPGSITGTSDLAMDSVAAGLTTLPEDMSGASMLQSEFRGAQRGLSAVPAAVALVSTVADTLIGELVGIGTGEIMDALFGKDVPGNFAQLFDDALKEVDRIVANQLSAAFTARKKEELQSLTQLMREYKRSTKHLRDSRNHIQVLLEKASDLLAFFDANGVVTNGAYQVTASLRLALLIEVMHLDQLLDEGDAKVENGRDNIRAQAKIARQVLEEQAATFLPTKDTTRSDRDLFGRCVSARCHSLSPNRLGNIEVCMVLESPGLAKPDPFCIKSDHKACKSDHFREVIRRRRIHRCLDKIENSYKADIKEHVDKVAMPQFRERNEATVFGEDFRDFLEHLKDVENMNFEDVVLPGEDA